MTGAGLELGWWVGEESGRSEGPLLNEAQWDVVLRQIGFSGLDGSLPDNIDDPVEPALGSVMFSTAVKDATKRYPGASLLLTERSQEFDVKPLREYFVDMNGNLPHLQYLSEISSQSSDGNYWIVLAFEGFSLSQLSQSRFVTLQNILLTSQGVLWVTCGVRGRSPEASMIEGLARVVRSENAAVKLVTLSLDDSPSLSNIETWRIISLVYAHVFGCSDANTSNDNEFIEEKGIIKVRRILEDGNKDKYIMRETQQPMPEPQSFIQDGRSLQLKLGSPGLLDSIYFEDDPKLKQTIADEAVEVEIKATGVSPPLL